MILFGSSPDQIAQQNLAYSQMYGQANQANANALSQAQLEQVRLALGQQNDDQNSADQQAQLLQSQNWQSGENALNRASRLADVQAQNGSSKQSELDFREALRQAQNGSVTADEKHIATLYPSFNDAQRGQIFQAAGNASVARAQNAALAIDRNGQGNAPDESIIKAAGVPAGTPFEDQVKTFIATLRQPYEQDYAKAQKTADAGNTVFKIQSERTPLPPPQDDTSWFNPVTGPLSALSTYNKAAAWLKGFTDKPVEADPAAVSRAQAMATTAATAATGNKTTPISIQGSPGAYTPALPANWRPAFAPQPVVAPVAQAVPPIAAALPPPPIAPAPVAPTVPTIPHVNSAAEYDALPDGAQYYDSRGKMATKRKRKSS